MDEQKKPQETGAKPFKTDEPNRPDLIVEPQSADDINSTSTIPLTSAVAVVAADDAKANPQISDFSGVPASIKPPHIDSISNIGKKTLPEKPKKSAPPKTPMTPRRFVNFVGGLFLAGMAGSFVNPMLTATIERAFPPQYVKNFHVAQALPDRNLAILGMHQALTEGQKVEFLSRRFTNLTATLAEELDNFGRYNEAKTEWAKAAFPSDVAPPDLRERKRSYIIKEGKSEHFAVNALMKSAPDADLLDEVESSAEIFQQSDVLFHGARAYDAYVTAGQLAADSGDFERADENFTKAVMFANSHWIEGASKQSGLLEAEWTMSMQEIVAALRNVKPDSTLPVTHVPSSLSLETRELLDKYVATKKWNKIDVLIADADKKHLQSADGESIASAIYQHLGTVTGEAHSDRINRNTLWEWAENTKSPYARIALAYWYNTNTARFSDRQDLRPNWSNMRQIYEAANNLQQALVLNPQVAHSPSFFEALQRNLLLRSQISSYEPHDRLQQDLSAIAGPLTRDEAQLALDKLRFELKLEPITPAALKERVAAIASLADKIGGEAGDEFYARAITAIGAKEALEIADAKRYSRGDALISKAFGTTKTNF